MIYDKVTISDALLSLVPNAEFGILGNAYEGIDWLDTNTEPLPSKKEIQAEMERLQANYDAKEYQRQRAPEYPDIKDQLDAIWKGGDAYEEMLVKVMEVKNKYPKPQ